jgi:hypothetical protein
MSTVFETRNLTVPAEAEVRETVLAYILVRSLLQQMLRYSAVDKHFELEEFSKMEHVTPSMLTSSGKRWAYSGFLNVLLKRFIRKCMSHL